MKGARTDNNRSWIGTKEKLVSSFILVNGPWYVLTMTVVGENESEILSLIRAIPKETDKV